MLNPLDEIISAQKKGEAIGIPSIVPPTDGC